MNENKSDWTVDTLKEHIEKIFIEKDKALNAALISSDKRLDLLNELRSGVATKEEVKALEKIIDDLKTSRDMGAGRGTGIKDFRDWVPWAIAVAMFLWKMFEA